MIKGEEDQISIYHSCANGSYIVRESFIFDEKQAKYWKSSLIILKQYNRKICTMGILLQERCWNGREKLELHPAAFSPLIECHLQVIPT